MTRIYLRLCRIRYRVKERHSVKRRTVGLGLVAAVLGGLGVYGASTAMAAPTEGSGIAVVASDERAQNVTGATDMDAMMRHCVEQLPADARDEARRMHEQMKQSMSAAGSGSMMNGPMTGGSMMGGGGSMMGGHAPADSGGSRR